MHTPDGNMNRRSFFKAGATAAGAVMAGQALAATPEGKEISLSGRIPVREFGKTGHKLPVFGHGGSAMIQQDIAKYGLELISVEERVKMVRKGYEAGIRYFDTARIYGESEGIMAEALHDVRDDIFLVTKVLVPGPEGVRPSVEQSLAELRTDYLDSVQIHGPTVERLGYEGCMPLYEELLKLKEEGVIRFIGLTGHSRFDNMYQLIDTGLFETLLIEFGYFRKGYNTKHSDQSVEWRRMCVARASEVGMGIAAMKVMGAMMYGHNAPKMVPDYDADALRRLPGAAIRHVLADPRIHVLNLGISMPGDIDANMAILTGNIEYTNDDRILLADFSARAYEHEYVQGLRVV